MPLLNSAAARLASVLSVLKELGVTARSTHLRVLRETLDNHPHYLGVWSVWEPDALDECDRAFQDSEFHDATGRFKPFCHRRFGEPQVEICRDFDHPVLGEYYQQPITKRRPVVIAPYRYVIGGKVALLATVAAPIQQEQRCLGAAGVDFSLDSLAEKVAAGCNDETCAAVDLVATELEAGLVFLDCKERVMTSSSSVPELLRNFTGGHLKPGQRWPAELHFNEARERNHSDVLKMEHRGVTIKVARCRRVRDEPAVVVLTRSVAMLKLPPLSSREDEVMRWLSEGKSNEEIGIILSISPHTVKNHLDRIYRKIGVDNRHAAMLAWSRSKAIPGTLPCP